MRIPNISMSNAVVDRLNVLREKQNRLNQELATGQRISLPSEDPQAASRIMTLRSEVSISQQYSRNVDIAKGISESTVSALSSLNDLSTRAGELAQLSSSGIASAAERSSYAVEINQIILQATEAANTQFNGQYLFNGTNTANPPFSLDTTGAGDSADHPTGVIASASVAAGQDGTKIQLSDTLSLSPFNRGANNVKLATFINNLVSLRNALEQNSTTNIGIAQTALNTSEADIVNSLAEVAAGGGRLESVKTAMDQRFSDVNGLINNETDVDIAQTSVDLSKIQTAYQAAMQAGANVLRLSLLDYIR